MSITPRQLSYVNALAAEHAAAWRSVADSNFDWGQDLPALKQTLDRVGAARPLLSYFGTAPLAAYGVQATVWARAGRPTRFDRTGLPFRRRA